MSVEKSQLDCLFSGAGYRVSDAGRNRGSGVRFAMRTERNGSADGQEQQPVVSLQLDSFFGYFGQNQITGKSIADMTFECLLPYAQDSDRRIAQDDTI